MCKTDHFVPKTPLLKSWFKRDMDAYMNSIQPLEDDL